MQGIHRQWQWHSLKEGQQTSLELSLESQKVGNNYRDPPLLVIYTNCTGRLVTEAAQESHESPRPPEDQDKKNKWSRMLFNISLRNHNYYDTACAHFDESIDSVHPWSLLAAIWQFAQAVVICSIPRNVWFAPITFFNRATHRPRMLSLYSLARTAERRPLPTMIIEIEAMMS